jgi:lambda repressor-like predicted transcriptional regulator
MRSAVAASIATAIDHLLADESRRRAMGDRALSQALALSWPRAARVALDALEDAGPLTEKVGSKVHAGI